MTTFGIVVGGGPAPGINGVIGAATILARQNGANVIGLRQGFHWLMQGDTSHSQELHARQVAQLHEQGGSVLQTSRANPTKKPEDLERVVRALSSLGIDRLISIGGDDTCHSARCVGEAAGDRLSIVHVPKTIDNDLPLPVGIPTFGYETARETAARILTTLLEDARTTTRWYLVVLMGRNAGHLAQGAAQSAGATVTLVAEEFPQGPIRLDTVARIVEGTIVRRTAGGEPHGVIVLAEGIGDRLDPADLADLPDVPLDEHGHVRLAELPLGKLVRDRVAQRLTQVGIATTLVAKDVGYELRCVPPNAFDQEYTRDLGAGAVRTLLAGGSNLMITRQSHEIVEIPFDEILDPRTGRTRVRLLDVSDAAYRTARALQVRLEPHDLASAQLVDAIAEATTLNPSAVRKRYAGTS
ncbi:MAG: 6-phosphofructokinase [Deltaproteobacteria bacterium]|nr:6-phosphofructokinase [Deltaproteobacteria bacterium]